MNGFDVVVLLTILAAGVALFRLRAATFLFAANQAAIGRSLSLIVEHGRPPSLPYVPRWVFHQHNTDVALVIFSISTALLFVSIVLPGRRKPPEEFVLPRIPNFFLAALAAYIVFFALSMRSVADVRYSSEDQAVFWLPTGGVQALAGAGLMYELYRRIRLGMITPAKAFLLYFGAFVLTDYSKGLTGMASGFVFTAAVLFFSAPGRSSRPRTWVFGIVISIVLLASVIRIARISFYEEGLGAVDSAVTKLVERQEQTDEQGEGLETSSSGHEFAALTLECITLYDSGNDRQWASTYRTFLYTFQPSFLVELTEWKRPKDAGDEIREHFTTTGGMAIYGESYWNGGYLGVVLILGAILGTCYQVDRSYRYGFLPLIVFCNFAPAVLQGVGYGISHEVRGLVNGFLCAGVYYGWLLFARVWLRLFSRTRSVEKKADDEQPPGKELSTAK